MTPSMLQRAIQAEWLTCVPLWPCRTLAGGEPGVAERCPWLVCLGLGGALLVNMLYVALMLLSDKPLRVAASPLALTGVLRESNVQLWCSSKHACPISSRQADSIVAHKVHAHCV